MNDQDTTSDATSNIGKAAAPVIAGDTDSRVALDEFCQRLSTKDRRVELIGAFHASERKERRSKDTEEAYQSRFVAFVNKPV